MRALLIVALLATPAHAACNGEVIFSCKIKAKTLELCLTPDTLRYSFGNAKPDLTITSGLAQAEYTPWAGIGRTIWDSVRFYNEDVNYEVWQSIDKQMSADEPTPQWQGGVIVSRGDEILADLNCSNAPDPHGIEQLSDAKQAIGQCWDFDNHIWAACN